MDTSSTVLASSIEEGMIHQNSNDQEVPQESEPLQTEVAETIEEVPAIHSEAEEEKVEITSDSPEDTEVEIEDILKEQAELLNSLADFDDDFL